MNEQTSLPPPPLFSHTEFRVPPYTPWNHPYTKWMLNTFRSRGNTRLTAMSKEHPELFQHIFQIPDTPEKITCDSSDYEAMYKRSTVLYLRPLSLAVYMRRLDIIKLLIDSRLVDNTEVSYATDISGHFEQEDVVELREIRPMTIAVRRNVLEALPIIFSGKSAQSLRPWDQFTLRYANTWAEKCSKFKDVFDYTINVVRRRRILPTARVFETLVFRCPGFSFANSSQIICAKHGGQRCSLFQRLAKYLLVEAGGNRLALPLLQSMSQLIQYRGFYKASSSRRHEGHGWSRFYSFSSIPQTWGSMSVKLKDRLVTLALMFKVHDILQEKIKSPSLTQTSQIISKMVTSLGCQVELMTTPIFAVQQSIQFLLQCSSTKPEQRGDMEPDRHRSANLKAPTKKALKVLLTALKRLISSDRAKSEGSATYSSYDSINLDNRVCPLCLKEAKLSISEYVNLKEEISPRSPLFEPALCDTTQKLLIAPIVDEDSLATRAAYASLLFEEREAYIITDAPHTLSTDLISSSEGGGRWHIEQGREGVEEGYVMDQFHTADEEESISSERALPKRWPREPCNLVEVDNLIEKIASSASMTNDYLLSDDDSELIDTMLKGCFDKTESTKSSVEKVELPVYIDQLCQIESTKA